MTYRKYYWKEFKSQMNVAFILLWHGVICNRGHHSSWKVKRK
jgi:hypothetical protein